MTYKRIMYKQRACCQRMSSPSSESYSLQRRGAVFSENRCPISDAPSLAAVYGVKQCWRDIDDTCAGFERGTIFDELNKPFMGDKCKNGGYCK